MSSFPILDLVAGMIFIYFLLSIIVSSALEIVITMGRYRAKMLEQWLLSIFNKELTLYNGSVVSLGKAILDHCSITALSKPGQSNAYINPKDFTSALIEKISFDPATPRLIAGTLGQIETAIQNTTALPIDLQRVLLSYANEARQTYASVTTRTLSELDIFKGKIEDWYNSNMERVGGALKTKYTRRFTFWISVVAVGFLNADSISIATYLYNNPEARIKLAEQSYASASDSLMFKKKVTQALTTADKKADSATVEELNKIIIANYQDIKGIKATLEDTIPLGWNKGMFAGKDSSGIALFIFIKLVGLAATVLAIMMGAPFWFDILNKIANLRGNGKKPDDSKVINTP
ncbi:hypothetical protein IM792_19260 [Mucilaginibacter sp. JRF]|uniref:hypothetical protein n=1 Tax=Mucilaginibacter sp. JRF TaxID=2780088 RepID=UPI0018811B6C|nr:hypothetical protein [Mucilaginibacter sp. JRF]MBE9586596.1 hypothetical protein [Mucilaginibacter sp. JRF]